ncbi:twin-arginine translocase TatA/TatE family subunit [Paramagnetospirillum kuznetsovii]|uniref:Sec-independent protein translocase protein TatA n=1 Tax=Paramagnetospirillum kuznetsovii TaxID=2053833 RepID=A0A364P069_9PROT|nr:twin-arginine translocase TatA/TatE family subunit [Paramagnetospirillum kuznetsovii]RAU22640.1 twin-arginine translocase TatA/TatE family subunit [Paramagnetospirillum kuznetsovii]
MGTWSIGHWLIVLIIVLLLFGANKIPKLMGDMAKGVKAFKHGLKDEDESAQTAAPAAPSPAPQARVIEGEQAKPAAPHDTAAKP